MHPEHALAAVTLPVRTTAALLECPQRLVSDQGAAAPTTTSHGDPPDRDEPH